MECKQSILIKNKIIAGTDLSMPVMAVSATGTGVSTVGSTRTRHGSRSVLSSEDGGAICWLINAKILLIRPYPHPLSVVSVFACGRILSPLHSDLKVVRLHRSRLVRISSWSGLDMQNSTSLMRLHLERCKRKMAMSPISYPSAKRQHRHAG